LLLGADEQDRPAAVRQLRGELLRLGEQRGGLEQVDDVDAASLAIDEAAHLGVPATRLVAEMNAGLQPLLEGYLSQCCSLVCSLHPRARSGPGITPSRRLPGQGRSAVTHGSKFFLERSGYPFGAGQGAAQVLRQRRADVDRLAG